MHLPLLEDILILLGFSVFVVFFLQRLRLPSILGFLITGVIIGPTGLSLVNAIDEVEVIAEIGVILLLFVIGMELSLKQLVSIRKTVFLGGVLQVGLTVLVVMVIAYGLGYKLTEAIFMGFLFSLSSTAIVLKILQERNEISTPHGRNALGILIFQDIIVVPMMLVTPIMAGQEVNLWASLATLVVKSLVVIGVTYVSARYLVPKLLYIIVKTNSKELFLLTTITICFTVAFLTFEAGLSLALGAFLAGLIISESEYSHQATSTILPFRELFTSIFFISVGMLLDLYFFISHLPVIILLVSVVFVVKGALASVAAAFLKYPLRTVLLTGLSLFQVGEFVFILSKVGLEYNLLTDEMNQYFLSVSIATMILTPFLLNYSDNLSKFLVRGQARKKQPQKVPGKVSLHSAHEGMENHLVIIGYGVNGRNVAKAAKYADIPYIILELNAATVRAERAKGEPIVFGDAVHESILHGVGIKQARVVVLAISDPQATKNIIANIRSISQSVYVVVRTRYVREIDPLIALGADEVIPEEFETSIEIFSRVLNNFLVPMDELETLVDSIRSDNYKMFRPKSSHLRHVRSTINPEFKITCVRIMADSGDVVGKTLKEAKIRDTYGVNVLAIKRNEEMITIVNPEEQILQNDQLFISGDHQGIEQFYKSVN